MNVWKGRREKEAGKDGLRQREEERDGEGKEERGRESIGTDRHGGGVEREGNEERLKPTNSVREGKKRAHHKPRFSCIYSPSSTM